MDGARDYRAESARMRAEAAMIGKASTAMIVHAVASMEASRSWMAACAERRDRHLRLGVGGP